MYIIGTPLCSIQCFLFKKQYLEMRLCSIDLWHCVYNTSLLCYLSDTVLITDINLGQRKSKNMSSIERIILISRVLCNTLREYCDRLSCTGY